MIKAIETSYAGCRFRSRLEARWAVFFDTLKIKWEYEVEGFETPGGRYLPDFQVTLPGEGRADFVFFEVKPPDTAADPRHQALVDETLRPLVLASGMARDYSDQKRESACGKRTGSPMSVLFPQERPIPAAFVGAEWGIDLGPDIGRYDLHYNGGEMWDLLHKGRRWVLDAPTQTHIGLYAEHHWLPCDSRDIDAAFAAARSARFEFGQAGAR